MGMYDNIIGRTRFDVLYDAQDRSNQEAYAQKVLDEQRQRQYTVEDQQRQYNMTLGIYNAQQDAQLNAQRQQYNMALDFYKATTPQKSNCKSFLGFGCGSEGFTDFWGGAVKSGVTAALGVPTVPTIPHNPASNSPGNFSGGIDLGALFRRVFGIGQPKTTVGTPPFNPNRTIYDSQGNPVTPSVMYAGPTNNDTNTGLYSILSNGAVLVDRWLA